MQCISYIYNNYKISDTQYGILALHCNYRKHQLPWVAISFPCNFNLSPKYAHASDLDSAVAVVSHYPSTFLLNNDALDPVVMLSPCHAKYLFFPMLYTLSSFLHFLQAFSCCIGIAPMCSTQRHEKGLRSLRSPRQLLKPFHQLSTESCADFWCLHVFKCNCQFFLCHISCVPICSSSHTFKGSSKSCCFMLFICWVVMPCVVSCHWNMFKQIWPCNRWPLERLFQRFLPESLPSLQDEWDHHKRWQSEPGKENRRSHQGIMMYNESWQDDIRKIRMHCELLA